MNSSNERNDVLCSLCSTLTASISDGAWEVIHSTYQDIQLQAQQGCTFCTALCLAIEPPGPNGHKSVHQIYENNVVHLRISPDHISTIMPYLENTQNYPYIGRILKNRVLKLRFNDSNNLSIDPSTARNPEDITTAENWLSQCLDSHSCRAAADSDLPTRLLDIGESNDSQIRLSAFPPGSKGKYASLSYCWGLSPQFTTTTDNIASRLQGFALSSLPPTLQDAVVITRELGLRFLWVDALCIMQGHDSAALHDWELESSRMDAVYGKSFITIVAASAEGSNNGILFRRPPRRAITINGPGGQNDTCGIRKLFRDIAIQLQQQTEGPAFLSQRDCLRMLPESIPPRTADFRVTITAPKAFKDEPINGRAWALQERFLSPRLLIYTWDELFWQCDAGIKSNLKENTSKRWHRQYKYRLPKNAAVDEVDWARIVDSYCSRNLTNSLDKLLAISGLARRYQRQNEKVDRYLAGMWESHLPYSLLWVRDDAWSSFYYQPQVSQPTSYRAPSWSWASVDGITSSHMIISSRRVPNAVIILKAHCEMVSSDDQFGLVKGGSLVLRGLVKRTSAIDFDTQSRGSSDPVLLAIDDKTGDEIEIGAVLLDQRSPRSLLHQKILVPAYCLLVTPEPEPFALVLEAVEGRQGVYRRIGVCYLRIKGWFNIVAPQTVTVI